MAAGWVSYAGYPTGTTYAVLTFGGTGYYSVVALSGLTASPSLSNAYRNADGSYYVCLSSGTPRVGYATAGGAVTALSSASACNSLGVQANTLFMGSTGAAGAPFYTIGTVGAAPTSGSPTVASVGTTAGGPASQLVSFVFDNLGTTLFVCSPTGAAEYGVTRAAWSGSAVSGATALTRISNVYCYSITGQARAGAGAPVFRCVFLHCCPACPYPVPLPSHRSSRPVALSSTLRAPRAAARRRRLPCTASRTP